LTARPRRAPFALDDRRAELDGAPQSGEGRMAMNLATNIPVVDTAIQGWRDALAAREKMPTMFWITLGVMIALGVLHYLVGYWWLSNIVFGLARGLALTPFALAIHRFVLLGEARDAYDFAPTDGRFQKFFLYIVGLEVLVALARIIAALSPILSSLILLVLSIVALIIVVRIVIVFPAIAVDAPGAEWRNAMEDTKGHSWSVFFVLICCAAPPVIVAVIIKALFGAIPGLNVVVAAIVLPALVVATVAASDAAISRLFASYANQLGRPSNLQLRPAV
jgi:hypothetical protein